MAACNLPIVSDDTALIAAVDEALAAQPDVLEKIRDGEIQAAGAVIGAVMKAMAGTADAARLRESVWSVLERWSQKRRHFRAFGATPAPTGVSPVGCLRVTREASLRERDLGSLVLVCLICRRLMS